MTVKLYIYIIYNLFLHLLYYTVCCSNSIFKVVLIHYLLFHFPYAATPNPPAITIMTFLSTSISLNWTHDKTCFESAPVKYHVLVNTETQPIVTDQLTAEIGGIISGTNYTVSVMALVDDSQRSEPDRESVTAGGYREEGWIYCIYTAYFIIRHFLQ